MSPRRKDLNDKNEQILVGGPAARGISSRPLVVPSGVIVETSTAQLRLLFIAGYSLFDSPFSQNSMEI